MPKITLLGAGSGFTQPLFTDILNIEGIDGGIIGLVDIDAQRLQINVKLLHRMLQLMGKTKWKIEASTDRKKVLKGTDYLISTIEVSGVHCVRHDNDIPLKYGIDQCIGDTIGPGGIMKALRTLPPFLEILADAQKLCPNALIMNYTNPMSIMTLGAVRTTTQPFVGLCHSVQGNSRQIANILRIPYEEMEWKCGGINHMAWFTGLKWRGQDMRPRLRAAAERPEVIEEIPVRADLIQNLGYFSTEGDGHFSEYVPYYRKRKDLIKKHCRAGYQGGTSFYADMWPAARKDTDLRRRKMVEGKLQIPIARGYEYASEIIEAHFLGRKKVIHASVLNTNLIPNLPASGVVEVATLVDRRGFLPTYFGNLPEQCAALCRSNMAVFELCVEGILNHDREAVIHAMMVDPLSAAVCSLGEIRAMTEELFKAEKDFIPAWCAKPKPLALKKLYSPASYIQQWQVVGPFRSPVADKIDLNLPTPVEDGFAKLGPGAVDLKAQYPLSGQKLKWKRVQAGASGRIDLDACIGKAEWACAYAYTEIESEQTKKVLFGFGSDDGIKVWLNGEVVHTNEVQRGCGGLTDWVELTLHKGVNRLLLKIDNYIMGWCFVAGYTKEPDQLQENHPGSLSNAVAEVSSMSARGMSKGKK